MSVFLCLKQKSLTFNVLVASVDSSCHYVTDYSPSNIVTSKQACSETSLEEMRQIKHKPATGYPTGRPQKMAVDQINDLRH